jgi:hypothetical protein
VKGRPPNFRTSERPPGSLHSSLFLGTAVSIVFLTSTQQHELYSVPALGGPILCSMFQHTLWKLWIVAHIPTLNPITECLSVDVEYTRTQTYTDRDTHIYTQAHTQSHNTEKHTETHIDTHTDRHTYSHTYSHTDRQTDRHTHTYTHTPAIQQAYVESAAVHRVLNIYCVCLLWGTREWTQLLKVSSWEHNRSRSPRELLRLLLLNRNGKKFQLVFLSLLVAVMCNFMYLFHNDCFSSRPLWRKVGLHTHAHTHFLGVFYCIYLCLNIKKNHSLQTLLLKCIPQEAVIHLNTGLLHLPPDPCCPRKTSITPSGALWPRLWGFLPLQRFIHPHSEPHLGYILESFIPPMMSQITRSHSLTLGPIFQSSLDWLFDHLLLSRLLHPSSFPS